MGSLKNNKNVKGLELLQNNINNDKIAGRLKELDFDLECIKYALEFYK